MDMSTETGSYQTSDIALASYLYCSGVHLLEIDRQNPRRCIFIFSSPEPDLLIEWQKGQSMVSALAFHNAYQVLKLRVLGGR